jgi:hypothetical protein
MIQALSIASGFKPDKLFSPSVIPYRESAQKIPRVGEIQYRE